MAPYCESLIRYRRVPTREVKIGNLLLGNGHPIRVQTMTTTDTMDTIATVEQTIRCIEAGAELVRITAPSKKEAENLANIRDELHRRGYFTPLVADIHFTPNAAEIAARIVEKVRVNPGNYADKKKFEFIEYTDAAYHAEIDRIRERFTPLVKICKEYGTAMRIGTNHGSLSDRIMSRYGDSPMGMVESAMEFLRIARDEDYHNIVLSMKSSNPLVMIEAYRLLLVNMQEEFGERYPLHIGVTEAGDGEDGRIKSAIGIGTLLEDGIGDTIRVSLTEDPEFEIPVCQDLVRAIAAGAARDASASPLLGEPAKLPWSPFEYARRKTRGADRIGGNQVPVVIADYAGLTAIAAGDLSSVGYRYDEATDKWAIADAAADFLYTGGKALSFALPGTLQPICDFAAWNALGAADRTKYHPLYTVAEYSARNPSPRLAFVSVDTEDPAALDAADRFASDPGLVLCLRSNAARPMASMRRFLAELGNRGIDIPAIAGVHTDAASVDEQLIAFSVDAGALLADGLGDGLWLTNDPERLRNTKMTGRTYLPVSDNRQFLNNSSFSILQATRTRISKTEYISCPSCGRTLFDLQETTAKIRAVTHHLKGLKIAIMGCIVNGPGEMADADFGYVGSGPGKITLYKGKDVVKKSVNAEVAVDELIGLLKENGVWMEPGAGEV